MRVQEELNNAVSCVMMEDNCTALSQMWVRRRDRPQVHHPQRDPEARPSAGQWRNGTTIISIILHWL